LRILKGTVIGMAVAATAIGTIVSHNSNSFGGGHGNATVAGLDSLQPVSAAPHPTTPKDTRVNSNPDAEYGGDHSAQSTGEVRYLRPTEREQS
jgi:hypothetical protein